MTPLAWLLGLFLPACGASGAAGLPTPALMDMAHIARPASPNSALAAPAGSTQAPDLVTPRYPLAASRLYALEQDDFWHAKPSCSIALFYRAIQTSGDSAFGHRALVVAVAKRQPRTFVAAEYPAERQVHFVARSAVLNFPDVITAQVDEAGPAGSTLVLYSRSVYGYSDLGVNRRRLGTWLAAVQSEINRSDER